MPDDYFTIEFQAPHAVRFRRLCAIFGELKRLKDDSIAAGNGTDASDEIDSVDWQSFLGDEDSAWFSNVFDFASDEGRTWQRLWDLTAPSVRAEHPMFTTPGNWSLEGTVGAILCGDYQLIALVRRENGGGQLTYDPWGGPFGGSECLVALLEGFGCQVTHDSWHGGPHARAVVGWDFQRASQLVAQGERITLARQLDRPQSTHTTPWWKFWGK